MAFCGKNNWLFRASIKLQKILLEDIPHQVINYLSSNPSDALQTIEDQWLLYPHWHSIFSDNLKYLFLFFFCHNCGEG